MVKEIIQEMIRSHLGWLVVWGGVFGAVIGAVVLLFKKQNQRSLQSYQIDKLAYLIHL